MLRKVILFFLLLSVAPAFAANRCKAIHLADLVMAQSGGFWQKGKTTGYFRALVYRLGWEHTYDIFQLQVMVRNTRSHRVRVLHCREIKKKTSKPRVTQKVEVNGDTKNTAEVQFTVHKGRYPGKTNIVSYGIAVDGKVTPK